MSYDWKSNPDSLYPGEYLKDLAHEMVHVDPNHFLSVYEQSKEPGFFDQYSNKDLLKLWVDWKMMGITWKANLLIKSNHETERDMCTDFMTIWGNALQHRKNDGHDGAAVILGMLADICFMSV